MKLLVFWCFFFASLGILNAGTLKRDVPDEKTRADEAIYGDLDGNEDGVQKDQEDMAYYDDSKEDEDGKPDETDNNNEVSVKLNSKSEIFTKSIEDVVTLPCLASSKDVVKVWYKESTVLFQGDLNIANKPNYNMTSNGDLQVTIKDSEDYGTYKCKLALYETRSPEVVHQVVPTTSPTITKIFVQQGKTVFDMGESFTLTCLATGGPKPVITWHKENVRLGTAGESLTISNVKERDAGSYRCLADNSVGKPAHSHIEIFVNHVPIVSVEKFLINSDHGEDAELVCEVKAHPNPSVVWQRDGQNIASDSDRITLKRENERNLLIIKGVTEKDFGQYTCVATNNLGKRSKDLKLTKLPALNHLEKKHHHDAPKDLTLLWKVESKQPISKHELQYRRKGESNWKTISPEVGKGENGVYMNKHRLKNLEPGIYETRARSMNTHGWGNYSDIIPFEQAAESSTNHASKEKHSESESSENDTKDTASIESPAEHRTEEITSVGESTSSSSRYCSSLAMIVLALLTLIEMRH